MASPKEEKEALVEKELVNNPAFPSNSDDGDIKAAVKNAANLLANGQGLRDFVKGMLNAPLQSISELTGEDHTLKGGDSRAQDAGGTAAKFLPKFLASFIQEPGGLSPAAGGEGIMAGFNHLFNPKENKPSEGGKDKDKKEEDKAELTTEANPKAPDNMLTAAARGTTAPTASSGAPDLSDVPMMSAGP